MSAPLKSQQELYDLFITTLQNECPFLTDTTEGSLDDGLGGTFSIGALELQRYITAAFNKTFFDLANGPEVTGGPDDLQTLAVDHFGDAFARPPAIAAVDTETFQRPTNAAGVCTILAGSVVKTVVDANGNAQRYATAADVTLTHAGTQTWVIAAGNATASAVYKDANGKSYTVSGTIVAGTALATTGTTLPPAAGVLTKFSGTGDATLTYSSVSAPDCKVTASIEAVVEGSAGNAAVGTITVLETSLTDPTVVCSNAGNATGVDAQDDATYRETIRNLLVTLRAAIVAAIEAAALNVAGVVTANAVEVETAVIAYDIGIQAPAAGQTWFYIPLATLYIADASGSASAALLALVKAAVDPIKAYGVFINYVGATAVPINWTAHIALNPTGPNFGTLSASTFLIQQSMAQYIGSLGPGVSFIKATADAHLLALWGPAGSNDLTVFTTTIPTGDVTMTSQQVAIAGTMATV
jgi:hypothetical protein